MTKEETPLNVIVQEALQLLIKQTEEELDTSCINLQFYDQKVELLRNDIQRLMGDTTCVKEDYYNMRQTFRKELRQNYALKEKLRQAKVQLHPSVPYNGGKERG